MEALHLAVGLGSSRTGLLHDGVRRDARAVPEPGAVAGAVVGDDAFAGDAVGGEPGCCAAPESRGGDGLFVVEDLGVDDAGAVIERGVDVAVTDAGLGRTRVVAVGFPTTTSWGSRRASSRRHGSARRVVPAGNARLVRWPGHHDRGAHTPPGSGSTAPSRPPTRPRTRCGPHPSDACCADARRGRLERSNKPSGPSARNRSRHLRTVFASTWNRSAVASIVQR